MPKEKSPLRILQREGDTLKKEIDAYMEECGLVLDDSSLKDRRSRMKKLFDRCGALRKKCKSLEKKLLNLSKGKEPTVIPNFDEMRDDEVERMNALEARLRKVSEKLEPDEVEESYFNNMKDKDEKVKKQGIRPPTGEIDDGSDDDEEEEEEDEDEEEEDEDEDEDETEDSKMDTTNPEEENEDDVEKEDDSKKAKFGRLSMFRRSKSDVRGEKAEAIAGKEKKDKKDKEKKDKGKEKSEKEKEKERKEQEKKEKKEKDKLEKERKEKEKKEQKEKEQEEKRKKKEMESAAKSEKKKGGDGKKDKDEEKRPDSPSKRGFGAKLFSRDTKKAKIEETKKEQSESEDEDDEEEEEDMEEEIDGEEEEEEDEDFAEEEEEEEEEEDNKKMVASKQDKKKGWSLFRRDKSPQSDVEENAVEPRQIKKENEKDAKKNKDPKKQVKVEEEEDEDEEDDEDDDEEYEDEEEEEEEEEESDDDQVVMKGKKAQKVESEEEEEESEDDEEEDESGEEEEEEEEEFEEEEEVFENESESEEESFKPPDEGMDMFEAVCDFDGEEEDDLHFKRGAVLTILSVREDGWWMAEDEEGNKGLVPSTYLKLKKDYSDYRDVQSPEVDEPERSVSPRSGKELWRGLRKSVTETGVTDVLTAMGAIPAGFRPSTTARHLKSDAYTMCNFLKPRFTDSCLGFQDLNWSPHENQIRAKTVRFQKILTILMVRNMPPCGVGIDIKSRHVRICFFDGDKIVSNIHTIQATWNKNDLKTWRFSPKVASLLPSILDGDCFIRSSHTEENIGLLFELCLSYVRPKTGEKGELSCGWVHLPLYDTATGAPIANKMYELQVQGGTPFEQDVEVDPSISRRSSSSKFRSMMSANKQPRLQIKFLTPTKEQKPVLDTLPETLVGSLSYLPFLSMFRNLQAVEILRDRIDLQNADLIHCPVMSNFPEATKYPDIMDALRSCWADKKLKNKKVDKKDPEQMKELFRSTFMDSVYPIMKLPSLPPYKWADEERDNERWQVISEFLQSSKQKGILAAFLAPGGEHSPFDMTEVAFNLLDSFQQLK